MVRVDDTSGHKDPSYVAKSLFAGGVAGCVAKTLTAPLDRVKILFQGGNRSFVQFTNSYTGPFLALRELARQEGVFRGWFRGHQATLLRIFPYAAVNYVGYEQFKRVILVGDRKQNPLFRVMCGSLAGMCSVTLTYPLDYLHSRLAYQVKQHHYRGVWHGIRVSIEQEGGVRVLYRGFVPTLCGIIPYAGVSFFSYERIKQFMLENSADHQQQLSVPSRLLAGALAGAAAQTAAYPFGMLNNHNVNN